MAVSNVSGSGNHKVVVVGGGMAGFAAAMGAIEQCSDVWLLEQSGNLGGNATNSNVGTFCGAYTHQPIETAKLVGYQFCRDFYSGLKNASGCGNPINYFNNLLVIPYDWSVLQAYLLKQLLGKGVKVLTKTSITEVFLNDNQVDSISYNNCNGVSTTKVNSVIDCSGNGIVAQLSGHEMIATNTYQAASQVFALNGIVSENEFSLNMALKKAMLQLIPMTGWPESFGSIAVVPGSLANGKANFKLTLPELVTDDREKNMLIAQKAKCYIELVLPQLAMHVASLKKAQLEQLFPQLGIRVQQRPKGNYMLIEQDVLTNNKFADGIAIGVWPIEEWHNNGKVALTYPKGNDGYWIPAGCLASPQFKNLYFAGKNISADTKAIGSARVIGTCLQTGYAAGKMAGCKDALELENMILWLNNEIVANNG